MAWLVAHLDGSAFPDTPIAVEKSRERFEPAPALADDSIIDSDITVAIIPLVASIDAIVEQMKAGGIVHFNDLFKVCEHYFGKPRNSGSSHFIFKTPWQGDPRINIQNDKGKAKPYQVRQVLAAIAKLADTQAQKAKAQPKPEITTDRKPPKKR